MLMLHAILISIKEKGKPLSARRITGGLPFLVAVVIVSSARAWWLSMLQGVGAAALVFLVALIAANA